MKSREIAVEAHGDQKYGKSTHPYVFHLDGVVDTVELMRGGYILTLTEDSAYFNMQMLRDVGFLHDTIEDTETTYLDICAEFGHEVADAVHICTHYLVDTYFDYIMKIATSKILLLCL